MSRFETNEASLNESINDNGNWLSEKEEGYYTFLIMSSLTTHVEEEIFLVSYFFPHLTGHSS